MNPKKSNKTIKDFYAEELLSDPYSKPNLQDISSQSDPQAYTEAMKETKDQKEQKKQFFERLRQKLTRGE
jgi:hypothetical protein